MSSRKNSDGITIAPLRKLDDFLTDSAIFQIPNFNDLEKWGNRVTNNLMYYQTNYFLMALAIFVVIGIIHPIKLICGSVVVVVVLGLFFYITNERAAAAEFKRQHPIVSLLLILSGIYFICYMFKSLLIFLLGIFLPFSITFVHASLRKRNLKNKIANKVEEIGIKKTPMGIFLKSFGMEPELI